MKKRRLAIDVLDSEVLAALLMLAHLYIYMSAHTLRECFRGDVSRELLSQVLTGSGISRLKTGSFVLDSNHFVFVVLGNTI